MLCLASQHHQQQTLPFVIVIWSAKHSSISSEMLRILSFFADAYTQCMCAGLQKCDMDLWRNMTAAICTHTAQPADLRINNLSQVFQVQHHKTQKIARQ